MWECIVWELREWASFSLLGLSGWEQDVSCMKKCLPLLISNSASLNWEKHGLSRWRYTAVQWIKKQAFNFFLYFWVNILLLWKFSNIHKNRENDITPTHIPVSQLSHSFNNYERMSPEILIITLPLPPSNYLK